MICIYVYMFMKNAHITFLFKWREVEIYREIDLQTIYSMPKLKKTTVICVLYAQILNVWYIYPFYPHLVYFYGTCRYDISYIHIPWDKSSSPANFSSCFRRADFLAKGGAGHAAERREQGTARGERSGESNGPIDL